MGRLQNYRFRFSSYITRVDRVQVKMTQGEYPEESTLPKEMKTTDGWTTVYKRPGYVSPADDGTKFDANGWKDGIGTAGDVTTRAGLLDQGEIKLRWDVAKQGGRRENRINEVRMDGVFNNPGNKNIADGKFVTPFDIITDIMYKYAGVQYDDLRYHKNEGETLLEIEKELSPLDNQEIGILFDKQMSVYEAVEKLQSGCAVGFQFYLYGDRYTVRLDNPNRAEGHDIPAAEILNLDDVEVDWNAELYGSFSDIMYAYNYSEKIGRRFFGKEQSGEILDIHRIEKEWKVETLLARAEDAKLKSDIVLEDFTELRPIIKNIKLAGEKWHDLRVYDIRYIDFSIHGETGDKYPQQLVRLIEDAAESRLVLQGSKEAPEEYVVLSDDAKETIGVRQFVGETGKLVRCQIQRVDLDTQNGVTTIDVRVTKRSEVMRENGLA